jgi:hypothetical protein
VLGVHKWAFFFMVFGANSITAYMLAETVDLGHVGDSFVGGLMQRLTEWGGTWPAYANALHHVTAIAILWLILLYMYRKGSFVRV